MSFGEKLKELRKRKDISQDKLGEKIGVHGRHIGKYERGDLLPNSETLIKIAQYFEVSTDYLLLDIDESKKQPHLKDRELLEKFETLEHMNDADKKVVISLIDAYIKKNMIENVMQH